ncbi:MAG: hypothetical protein ACTSVF_04865 [Candidatus Asgardarchaeia archaeon]
MKKDPIEPVAFRFELPGKMKSYEELGDKVGSLPDAEIIKDPDRISVIKIESRDIENVPYLFEIFTFEKDRLIVEFTVTPGISSKKRNVNILRMLINLLSVVEDAFQPEYPALFQYIDMVFAETVEYADKSYDEIFSKYEYFKKKYEDVVVELEQCRSSNDKISRELMKVKERNRQLSARIRELETYSDDALMVKVQEWIKEHGNEIDISEFSKIYKVPEKRVEEILNKMVFEGYLQPRR